MKKSFALLLAGIMAAILSGCADHKYNAKLASLPQQQRDRALFDLAIQHMAKKDYDPAIDMLHTIINVYPESPLVQGSPGGLLAPA